MEKPEEKEVPDVITSDTDNATTIHPKEAPPDKRAKFRRLRAYNTDLWNGPKRENKEAVYNQDDLHRYDSLASSLALTKYQKSRGRMILERFDSHKFGQSIDHIIFGICVVVANADVESGVRYWPQHPDQVDQFGESDEHFAKVAKELGFDCGEQMSTIEKVQDQLNER